ncbi:hypothetical protein [Sphingomonas sp.]
MVDPQARLARQGDIDVAIGVDRQEFQPVERIVTLGRIAQRAPVLRPA